MGINIVLLKNPMTFFVIFVTQLECFEYETYHNIFDFL